MPDVLVTLCSRQDDDTLPNGNEWQDAHIVRLVAALNDLRMATVNTAEPMRLLLSSARTWGMQTNDILDIARQVSDHAGEVSALFAITDGSNETGYLDFVARCLTEVGWPTQTHSS